MPAFALVALVAWRQEDLRLVMLELVPTSCLGEGCGGGRGERLVKKRLGGRRGGKRGGGEELRRGGCLYLLT